MISWLDLQYEALFPPVEWTLNPTRKQLGTPITFMPLLHSWHILTYWSLLQYTGSKLGKTVDLFSLSSLHCAFQNLKYVSPHLAVKLATA